MSTITISLPRPSRRAWKLTAVAFVAVALAAVVGFVVTGPLAGEQDADGSPVVSGPPEAPFELAHPTSWQPVSQADLAGLPGSPLAVVRRKDGQATLVVDRTGRLDESPEKLAAGLDKRLAKRFPDFRKVSAKTVTVSGGRAFVYSFARTKEGTAQTIALLPAGQVTYQLNAVVRPDAPDAAREVGAMIASFNVKGPRP